MTSVLALCAKAVAYHALAVSPRAATWLHFVDAPWSLPTAQLPRPTSHEALLVRLTTALQHTPITMAEPKVLTPLADDGAIAAFVRQHHIEVMKRPAHEVLGRILPLPATALRRYTMPFGALVEAREPVAFEALTVMAEIEVAARQAPWPPTIVVEGDHADARRACAQALLEVLARDGVTHVDDVWRAPSPAMLSVHGSGVTCHYFQQPVRPREVVLAPKFDVRDLDGVPRDLRRATLWQLFLFATEPADHSSHSYFRPKHAELLAALSVLQQQPTVVDDTRVIWARTRTMRGGFSFEPCIQKPAKGGGMTKGALAKWPDIVAGRHGATEQDQRAARAHSQGYATFVQALVGHPLVFDVDRTTPLNIASYDARLHVDPTDEGYVLRLMAGEHSLAPHLISAIDPIHIAHTTAQEIAVVTIEKSLRTVAQTLRDVDTVPLSAAGDLHTWAGSLVVDAPVVLPVAFEGHEMATDARCYVRLNIESSGELRIRLGARPLPHATLVPPGEGDERCTAIVDGKRCFGQRHLKEELAHARAVREQLPRDHLRPDLLSPWIFFAPTVDSALATVEALLLLQQQSDGLVVEWKDGKPSLIVLGKLEAPQMRVAVHAVQTWLSVDANATHNDEQLAFGTLLEAVRNGRRYLEVSPGRFVALAEDLRARLAPLAAVATTSAATPGIEMPASAAPSLDALFDGGAVFDDTAVWRNIRARGQLARAVDGIPSPALLAELRPYQQEGVRFLRRLAAWDTGGVLADDMGLGKTVQAIALLLDRHSVGPQLVMAPTSVVLNWQRELSRFAPSLRVRLLADADTKDSRAALIETLTDGDVLLVGYALATICADLLEPIAFATAVFDEAQALKNPETHRAQLARNIQAQQKIALSGTPIENHLGELWSIFRIVSPGLLGSAERFRSRFSIPIEREGITQRRRELSATLRPFLLRRTKSEVLGELPPKTECVISVELSPDERYLYDSMRAAILVDVAQRTSPLDPSEGDRRFRVLAGLTRLRLLACHPLLLDDSSRISSSKLHAVVHHLRASQANGHRCLVFSQFVKHLALVQSALEGEGFRILTLDGSTPERERQRRIDAFQRGEADVFLLSLKAGGAGINLTAADDVLHLDPWWNPAVEDQATARAHRMGQTRPVNVYRFVSKDTIEERMLVMHQVKRHLVDSVLEGSDAAGRLSVDDLIDLIRGH